MDERPKLRQVEMIPFASGGERLICFRDPTGLSNQTIVLPPRAFFLAALCDGKHTLREIQAEYMRQFGDLLFLEKIEEVIRQLDAALMIESETFEAHRRAVA